MTTEARVQLEPIMRDKAEAPPVDTDQLQKALVFLETKPKE